MKDIIKLKAYIKDLEERIEHLEQEIERLRAREDMEHRGRISPDPWRTFGPNPIPIETDKSIKESFRRALDEALANTLTDDK